MILPTFILITLKLFPNWTALSWTWFIQLHTGSINVETYRCLKLSVQNRILWFPLVALHFILETYLLLLPHSPSRLPALEKLYLLIIYPFLSITGPWPLFLNHCSSPGMAVLHIWPLWNLPTTAGRMLSLQCSLGHAISLDDNFSQAPFAYSHGHTSWHGFLCPQ